ncbi:tape measure protein [Stutzerimonas stutzeri]|uniref:tape measure protein n=1 Tax=Stutzerimonas stutzeri TaxID=316 RepID=UPI000F7B4CD0|nr:tape measure protein [Stutzerimonas stutzeri]
MARPVSSFYAQIGIQTRLQDLQRVDKYLKLLEGKVRKTTAALQKDFSKTLVLPTLKIKKVQIDNTLNAQRSIQTDLNRIGRLTELRIGSVKLDEARITRQVQNVFTRAASAARLNVRSIAGTHGGASLHYPTYSPRLPHMPNTQSLGQYAGGFGGGFGLGAALPMLGPAGIAAGAVLGGGAYAVSKANELRQLTGTRETQRLKLDTAVGDNAETRSRFRDMFINLADNLGISAEGQVDSFSRFLKQAKSSGLSAEQGFDLYKNVATATRGNGGTEANIEGQNYALSQILGLGYLRNEELSGQLADQNPAIKKFIMEAFAERTGKTGTEAFLDALSKRQVSVQDVLRGYEKSAQEAAGRVDELSNSIEGANARLQNMRFAEEMERTVSGPMSKAALEYTEAQRKLTEATQPLRDVMYNVAAAGTSLAAKFLSWTADRAEDVKDSPAVKGEYSPEQQDTSPTSSASSRGLLSVPSVERLKQSKPATGPILPIPVSKKEWQVAAEGYASPEALLEQMSTTNNISMQASMTISPGGIVVNTQATDAEQLAQELEPHIRQQFDNSLQGLLTETDIAFGSK